MEQHEFEFETVTLTDEEGVERDFDILAVMEFEGNEYYALVDAMNGVVIRIEQ